MSGGPVELEGAIDALYDAELDAFVAERTAIVKALRAEGRKAEAARVAELRKPPLAAWAVNRLVRRRRKEVDALIAAGEALETAQKALLSDGGQDAFADARDREQAAMRKLRTSAAELLGGRASESTLERVVATLRAAAATPDGREQLAAGRLTAELEPRGFDAFAGLAPAPPTRKKADPRKVHREAVAAAQASLKAAREREADAARSLREAERSLATAERAAADARAARDAAADGVEAARRELDAAKVS